MKQSIGIDIGATKIIFVLLKDKKVIKKVKITTPKNKNLLIKALKDNLNNFPKTKIGIGVPGIVKKGKIIKCPNLKYLNNFNLAKELKGEIIIENDANCFAFAETILGAGKNKKVVLGITLGSGLGSGLVINKKIHNNLELGHRIIKPDGYKCSCGRKGCLECYASAKFLKRKRASKKTFKQFGEYLGIGLNNALKSINVEVIVIGGGISKSWKSFLKETKKQIKKGVELKVSKLGETAGAIGAALISVQ